MIEIGKNTFPWYLWDNYRKGYTGSLWIQSGTLWKEIYFDHGLPVGAKSNILKECLGRLLVSSGKLPIDKCEDSLILMKGLKKRQGEALVRMGLIKEDELPELLKFQLKVRLLDLFGWRGGVYSLREGIAQHAVSLDDKIGKIIIDGVKERYTNLEKELLPLKGKYLKKSDSFESVIKEFGLETSQLSLDGKPVDSILSLGKDPVALLYAFLLTGALTTTETSEEWVSLNGFYEKIKDKNHFEVLGLGRNCSDADVKKAYWRLAKEYHPDLFETNPDAKVHSLANEIFCLISSAYEVLSDRNSRREYEDHLKRGKVEGEVTSVSRILLAEMEFKKGQTYLRVGNFEGAAKSFQLAVDMNPDEGEFCAYLGWAIYNRQGKSAEEGIKAMEYVKKALSMNSRIPMAYYFLGFMYRVEGDIDAALKEFDRALRLKPDLTEPLREIRLINSRKEKAGEREKKSKIFGFLKKG